MNDTTVEQRIKSYILSEFLPGEDPAHLTGSTSLITSGILDSLAVLKLILFIERQFAVKIKPQEVIPEHLGTIEDIGRLVRSKN